MLDLNQMVNRLLNAKDDYALRADHLPNAVNYNLQSQAQKANLIKVNYE